jgi:abhydrolase domain-containing protein 13
MPEGWRNPSEHRMAYEDVWLMTPDKKQINGWLIKVASEYENAKTILFFHGNAGNIGARLPNLKILVQKMNCNVFIIDYRGYGSSEGKPTEAGLKVDAKASLDYLRKRTDINQ